MKYGVQMFSLRGMMKDEEGFDKAFAAVKDMGAEVVQLSATGGSGIAAEAVGRISRKYDLPVCITHDPYPRLKDELEKVADEHEVFGCRNLGIGMMPKEFRTGKLEDIMRFVDFMNATAEKLSERDMTLSYHNHWFEFDKIDDKTIYDILIDNTEKVKFIPDTYWMRFKGVDIVGYISKLDGRMDTVHFKDYKRTAGLPLFRAVGKGEIDFVPILKACKSASVQNVVVELDMSPNPLKSVAFGMKTLLELKQQVEN